MASEEEREFQRVAEALNSDDEEIPQISNRSKRQKTLPKRSNVWDYFEEMVENDKRYAKCKLCVDKELKYLLSGKSNSSTGNMSRHLEKDHPDRVLRDVLQQDETPFVFSQENFRKALIKWIVLCDQPFTEPEQEAFAEVVHSLNPEAELISAKTVKSDIMKTYEEYTQHLKGCVSKIPGKLSITIDGWTPRNVLPFLAIRGHWLESEWSYRSVLLDFCYIHGKHSGYKQSNIFRDCLSRLGIAATKILAITGDNAGNNDTFFQWLEDFGFSSLWNQIRCMCHIINLAAQDLLNDLKVPLSDEDYVDDEDLEVEDLDDIDMDEEINEEDNIEDSLEAYDDESIIVKIRTLVKKIRKSVQLRQKLQKCCQLYGQDYLVPKIDVKSRWNSTYYMIVRAKELKTPLRALCAHQPSLAAFNISEDEWSYLNSIETLLAKFERATKRMSMERHVTIHSYIPTLDWLIQSVEKFMGEHTGPLRHAAQQAFLKLKKYEVKVDECVIPFVATVLHPSLKLNYFKENGYSASAVREIKKGVSEYFTQNYETTDNVEPIHVDSEEDEFEAHMFRRSRIQRTTSEFEQYLNLPLTGRKTDPLDFWKSQAQQFPYLSKMARDFLPVQPSSVSVERDFSQSSKVVTPARCSLLQSTKRATMSLKSWFNQES